MTDRRFRAHLPRLPEVGERLRVRPEYLVEEWDLSTGGIRSDGSRTSFVPRRLYAREPRPGVVVKVTEHATYADVMLDDPPARLFSTGAILTVIGPVMLCHPRELRDLLDHVTFTRTLHTDEQRAAVANQVSAWLRREFSLLARIGRWPDYKEPERWSAWLEGVEATATSHGLVSVPPFEIEVPAESMPGTRPTLVRKDAISRLIDRGRAN